MSSRMCSDCQIVALKDVHWKRVREIYLEGISTANATFETKAPSWDEWDAGHHPFARCVALANGKVAGWAALIPVSKRRAYAGVAEVSVYVAAKFRGQGIGTQLLLALIAESERHSIWTLQASIFPENRSSLELHRRCGFRVVGERVRIAQLNGIWRNTLLLERRSAIMGT